MQSYVLIVILAFTLGSCSSTEVDKARKFPDDQKLITSWQTFKMALNKSDTASLKFLSQDCINSMEADTAISNERFFKDHFGSVFSARLLSYINDSTSVSAGYDGSNVLELHPCLAANSGIDNPRVASVLVDIPIKGEKENLTMVLDFIQTRDNYKFCGYYTIP